MNANEPCCAKEDAITSEGYALAAELLKAIFAPDPTEPAVYNLPVRVTRQFADQLEESSLRLERDVEDILTSVAETFFLTCGVVANSNAAYDTLYNDKGLVCYLRHDAMQPPVLLP